MLKSEICVQDHLQKTSGVLKMKNGRDNVSINIAINDLRLELDKEICRVPTDYNRLIRISKKLDALIAGYYQKKYRKIG
jgi:hypothetical protein